jgi:AraC-like DNA-binding protein
MARDAMSDMLTMLDAKAVYAGGMRVGGEWAIRFPPPSDIKFFAIGEGECWVQIEGDAPVRLQRGDVFLFHGRASFVLASDLSLPALDAKKVFHGGEARMVSLGTGDGLVLLGSHMTISSERGRLFVDSLPPSIHVAARDAEPLRSLLQQFVDEARVERPGGALACTSLAQLMFLHVLRAYVRDADEVAVGWLRVACDVELAPALRLMHTEPARAWSLPELARACAMSRTRFATYFKEVAGVPPLTYLTQWRMQLARRRLHEDERVTVGAVARAVGYESEAAFSTAFKRVMGHSPRRAPRQAST